MPSSGDTAYAGTARHAGKLYISDYTNDPHRDIIWLHGMLRSTRITIAALDLSHLLKDEDDTISFEQSIGGTVYKGSVYFNCGRADKDGACKKIEDWQILSPVRNQPYGVEALNRFIQNKFRYKTKEFANRNKYRKIPKPMGREEIIYGDKVINLKNHRRKGVWPKEEALCYLANGEIGAVVGQFKRKNSNIKGTPRILKVEFASQPCFQYDFYQRDFGEEAEPMLELDYALTVHKVQAAKALQ